MLCHAPGKLDRPRPGRRRGSLAIELLLMLPIPMALLGAMVEFSLMLTARQHILAASREGARVAAHGGTDEEVKATVKRVLGEDTSLGEAEVEIRRIEEDPANAAIARDRVEVKVQIPVGKVTPDLLAYVGLSLRDQELVAVTIMNQE